MKRNNKNGPSSEAVKGLLIFGFLSFLLLGHVSDALPQLILIPSETQVAEPGADAHALYRHIHKYDPYRFWSLLPGKERFREGAEPHGKRLATYVNRAAFFSVRGGKGFGDGSIIVQEEYSAERKLLALTAMYKVQGYNPEGGDWFWVKYGPDGSIEVSGKVDACIACHAKTKDYVFSGVVRK